LTDEYLALNVTGHRKIAIAAAMASAFVEKGYNIKSLR